MSEAPKFYKIENLSDILSKFRMELNAELLPIKERLDRLEGEMSNRPVTRGERVPEIIKTKYWKYEYKGEVTSDEEEMSTARVHAMSTISIIGAARRSMFGYAMLLEQMGLSKDQKQMVRQVESGISALMRFMQAARMFQLAMATTGPVGWMYLAMAGGMGVASVIYSGRTVGGG